MDCSRCGGPIRDSYITLEDGTVLCPACWLNRPWRERDMPFEVRTYEGPPQPTLGDLFRKAEDERG